MGDGFNLDGNALGERCNLYGGPGRRGQIKIATVYIVYDCEVSDIRQEDGSLDHLGYLTTGSLNDCLDVLHALTGLVGDRAPNELFSHRIKGHLTRNKEEVTNTNTLTIRTYGLRSTLGTNCSFLRRHNKITPEHDGKVKKVS